MEWYQCATSKFGKITCIGPFNDAIRADVAVIDGEQTVLLSVCKYQPLILKSMLLKYKYLNSIYVPDVRVIIPPE
jgi:hypothetical protein